MSRDTTGEPYLLIVEDHPQTAKCYVNVTSPYLPVRHAASVGEAEAMILAGGIAAIVLDELLPGGRGTRMIQPLRARCPCPLMIISSLSVTDLAVKPAELRARFVSKSDIPSDLVRYAAAAAVQDEVQRLVASMSAGTELEEIHRELIRCAPWVPRSDLPEVLGKSAGSVRAYIGAINRALRTGTYERLQALLDPFHIFRQRGGYRDSGVMRRIETLDDLRIPIEPERAKPRRG